MILLFINNYISKYEYDEFNRLIHKKRLTKLEMKGLTMTDKSFFFESLQSISNPQILEFLLDSFDKNKYISKLSIDNNISDDGFVETINKPKEDSMTNQLYVLLSKSTDKSMKFIVKTITKVNGIFAPQLILNNVEMFNAIIQCFCTFSYIYGKSFDILKMFIIFNENEESEFDYERIKVVVMSLCRVINHLREMKQFYNKNEENGENESENHNETENEKRKIDFTLPNSFNDYLKRLEERCLLIQQCELHNPNNEMDDVIESKVIVALSYICNCNSISNEMMISLLERREIRTRIRIAGLRMYSLLLNNNDCSNSLILNGFLSSLCGKHEDEKLSIEEEINSYHHYSKDTNGCKSKYSYELKSEFLNFLISFKNSMIECFNKQYYNDLLYVKELYMDYRECDCWILEESKMMDLFNHIIKFNKIYFLKDINMIKKEKCLKHYYHSVYDAISDGYFNKSEILLELFSMNLGYSFWKRHGIEPGLDLHYYVKYISEENVRLLSWYALEEIGIFPLKKEDIKFNYLRHKIENKDSNEMEIEDEINRGSDDDDEEDDDEEDDDDDEDGDDEDGDNYEDNNNSNKDDYNEMEIEDVNDSNGLDDDDYITTTSFHRNIHDDISSTCIIDDLCNSVIFFIISSLLKDGEIKKISYEKKNENVFELLFKKHSKTDIPQYQPMIFELSEISTSKSNPLISSLFSYIQSKLNNILQFYQHYMILSYESERNQLISLIRSSKQGRRGINIDIDLFNEDESIMVRKLTNILSELYRISDLSIYKEWIKKQNVQLLFIELYPNTTIPNQIFILKCIKSSLIEISTHNSTFINKVIDFIMKLLLELGKIILFDDNMTFKTDDYTNNIKSSSIWNCLLCDCDNESETSKCKECELPYLKVGIIFPSHDNIIKSFNNYNGDNLIWKRTVLLQFLREIMNNDILLSLLFNSSHNYMTKMINSLKSVDSLIIDDDIYITTAVLSIHGGIQSIISKDSIVEVNIMGVINKCRVIEMKDCYSKLKIEIESTKKEYEVDYDSIVSSNIPSIPLIKSPYSSLLCDLIKTVYDLNENNLNKTLPYQIETMSLLTFNYLKYEIYNDYELIPTNLLEIIIKSIMNKSISISNLPISLSSLHLYHLLTFNSEIFYSMNYLFIKSFTYYQNNQILSETTGCSIELTEKAMELYDNPNEVANWLIENKEKYKDYPNELFQGELPKDILSKQNIDYSQFKETNLRNNEKAKIYEYCNLSKYDNKKILKTGQIVFIDSKPFVNDRNKVFSVFLYQQNHINYFITIKNNQSTIICINDDMLKESVYFIEDKYGYKINRISNSLDNIKTISNTLSIVTNRDILVKLMIINPVIYSIEDPNLFLRLYKRLSSGKSLNTTILSDNIEKENGNNSFEIMTKIYIDRLMDDMNGKKFILQNEISPCEYIHCSDLSITSLSISEMLWNLNNSSSLTNIIDYKVVESLHPLFDNSEYIGKVSLHNCKSMIIIFDDKSDVGEGDLSFSYDKTCGNNIISFDEDDHFQPFVVNSNTVYYRMSYESCNTRWGYRFFAIGLGDHEKLPETNLVSYPNLEWSLWLLNIILVKSNINNQAKQKLFNILIKQYNVYQNKGIIMNMIISLLRDNIFIDGLSECKEIDSLAYKAFDNITKSSSMNNDKKFLLELYCISKLHSNPVNFDMLESDRMSIDKISSIYSLLYEISLNQYIPLFNYSNLLKSYTKTYQSKSSCSHYKNVKYEYECGCFNDFDVVIHKNIDIGYVYFKIMYNNEIIIFKGRFDKDLIYQINYTNKIIIEAKLFKSKSIKYKISVTIKPICNMKYIKILRNNNEEEIETYNYKNREITNVMNIINKCNKIHHIRIKAFYKQYVKENGSENIPTWDIYKLLKKSIKIIGKNIIDVLKYVDLSQINVKGSFVSLIQENKMLISKEYKRSYLNQLQSTLRNRRGGRDVIPVNIDRFKANTEKENRIIDSLKSNCVFKQIYKKLYKYGEKLWFANCDGYRVFEVRFNNEEASDAGGPYRECLEEMIEDLFSEHFDLFIPTSNNKHKYGIDTDCFIPNPNCKEVEHLKMYEFIGRIMGYSILSKSYLPFMFPKCFWKVLKGDELKYEDISDIDQYLYQNLEEIINAKNEEELPKQQAFIISDEKGEIINLNPENGKEEELKMENKEKHCELIINYIIHRCDIQIKSILNGLFSVVPQSYFFLFDGDDIEELICGKPEIDIEYLKEHTIYEGYNNKSQTIINFWKVMESFNNEERRKFIKFVWGRSRLPMKGEDWGEMFVISRCDCSNRLPIAHTCDFNIELPDYRNYGKLEKNIRTVINYGLGSMLNC